MIHLADVVDDLLERRIRRFADEEGMQLVVADSPNFLSPRDFVEEHTGPQRKKPFMARFYEAQRKRMDILVDPDGEPVGGRWSFDEENRKKWPKGATPPQEPCVEGNSFVEEAISRVEDEFADRPSETQGFRWPVKRRDAEHWLKQFFEERFHDFGPYEDAIFTGHAFLHHSAMTPMLNIGLLNPADLIEATLKAGSSHGIGMASQEGFIRQVIGWREFMCGIYRHRSVPIRTRNFWGFTKPIPQSFYDGTTGIGPVDRVIRTLLKEGYCHHIERLMVLGSFMLLCRFDPDAVYRWFMEMFIDSYDWVMVPNVYGMSQFADGGTFTTKPYLCGSNYILKMSNERKGDWCTTWDGLYWTFIADHSEVFGRNPRMSMMKRIWEKMAPEKQEKHRKSDEDFLGCL